MMRQYRVFYTLTGATRFSTMDVWATAKTGANQQVRNQLKANGTAGKVHSKSTV